MGQVVVQQCSQFTVSLFSGNVEGSTEYRAQRARVATSTACALSRQSQNTFFPLFCLKAKMWTTHVIVSTAGRVFQVP